MFQNFRLLANLEKLDFFKWFPQEIFEILEQQLFSISFTGYAKIKIIQQTKRLRTLVEKKRYIKKSTKEEIPSQILKSFVCRNSTCIYLFKFSSRIARTRCSVCSKSAIKIPKRRQRLLLSLMLTLN